MQIPARQIDESLSAVVEAEVRNFATINERVSRYAGGFKDKVVLEIGTGLHTPQGGALCALALREGAQRAFGIDVIHPCTECLEERKAAFWRTLQGKVGGLEPAGYAGGPCCAFVSRPVLGDDAEHSRLTFLQMSASAMYFRDCMFDLILSNAVFEHLKKPAETLREMKRVLKPGGCIYISWNPFTSLRMGGHDIGIPYYYPWAHLRLSEEEHVRKLGEAYGDRRIYEAMPAEHRPSEATARRYARDPSALRRDALADLNRMRMHEFMDNVRECGLQTVDRRIVIDEEGKKYLDDGIRQELAQYSEEELLAICMEIVLRK